MLRYKDFAPKVSAPKRLLRSAEFESLEGALEEANLWLSDNQIEPLNVETVVLPNIWRGIEEGTSDASLNTTGGDVTTWHQFVRVWYRAEG